jgi:hypothetical protein
MSTESDQDALRWGGLALGIALGLIDEGTTDEDVKRNPAAHNALKATYELLKRLNVGKVGNKFVDTAAGVRAKVLAAAAESTRRSESK